MIEKAKAVKRASASPQVLNEFAASFILYNSGREKNSNSTSEELNVAWQQKTVSEVKSNYTLQYKPLKRKSMLLTKTSILHENQE